MLKINDTKLLKIVKHFIVNQDYKIIVTASDENVVFLESISRRDFEVICIVKKNYENEDQYRKHISKISDVFNKIKTRLLKIKLKKAIIFVETNDFVNDNDVINDIEIFKTTNGQFQSQTLQKAYPTLNSSLEEINMQEKQEFNSVLNEIKFSTNQRTKSPFYNFKQRGFNTHSLLVMALIIIHIAWFFLYDNGDPEAYYNKALIAGASTFQTTFINGQFWRPLTAIFASPFSLNLAIQLFISSTYCIAIWNMLGNKWYLIFMFIASYITFFLATLFIPAQIFFGISHFYSITLGAFIACYILDRIEFVKFYSPIAKSNAFLFIIFLFLSLSTYNIATRLIAVFAGLITAFLIISIKQNDTFNALTSTLSISLIIGLGLYFWNQKPIKKYITNKDLTIINNAIDEVYPEKAKKLKTNICNYYKKNANDCK